MRHVAVSYTLVTFDESSPPEKGTLGFKWLIYSHSCHLLPLNIDLYLVAAGMSICYFWCDTDTQPITNQDFAINFLRYDPAIYHHLLFYIKSKKENPLKKKKKKKRKEKNT